MASLFESLSSAINPEIVSALGKALGADTSAINQGLSATGPLLMGSMSKMASTPSGAESLLKMLPQDTGTFGGFGSLTSLISNLFSGGPTAGNSMLSSLLGPGANAIGGALTKALGFNVMPLIGMVAPALMGLVSKAVQTDKLDANGLAGLLKRETTQFSSNPANAATMKLVNEATGRRRQGRDSDWILRRRLEQGRRRTRRRIAGRVELGPRRPNRHDEGSQGRPGSAAGGDEGRAGRFSTGRGLRRRPHGKRTEVGARDGEGSRRPDASDSLMPPLR